MPLILYLQGGGRARSWPKEAGWGWSAGSHVMLKAPFSRDLSLEAFLPLLEEMLIQPPKEGFLLFSFLTPSRSLGLRLASDPY